MRWVVVPECGARRAPAPTKLGLGHESMEVLEIQIHEQFAQVVALTLRTGNEFTAAHLAQQMQAAPNVFSIQIEPVPMVVNGRNRFSVQLAQQNIGEGLCDGGRRTFK